MWFKLTVGSNTSRSTPGFTLGAFIITSLAKELMFLVALVSLSVCLSVVCLWTTLLKKL